MAQQVPCMLPITGRWFHRLTGSCAWKEGLQSSSRCLGRSAPVLLRSSPTSLSPEAFPDQRACRAEEDFHCSLQTKHSAEAKTDRYQRTERQ